MDTKRRGLGDKETNLLLRHSRTLKQEIRMGDIVHYLIVEGVLTSPKWEYLKKKSSKEKERTGEFLSMLQV